MMNDQLIKNFLAFDERVMACLN